MKQLHPRAVWLFFIHFITALLYIFSAFGFGIILVFFSRVEVQIFLLGLAKSAWAPFLIGMALFVIFLYVWARLTYHFYLYELTENSFRKEQGVIFKKYLSIPYDRIQNIDIYRGIWARILGLSDLHIQTAGSSAAGKYGAFAEGRLPGLSKQEAEELREELIRRVRQTKDQGL